MAFGDRTVLGSLANKDASTSRAITTSATAPAGRAIVVGVSGRDSTGTGLTFGVTDSASNVYSEITGVRVTGTSNFRVFICENPAQLSSGGTITISGCESGQAVAAGAISCEGVATSSALETQNVGQGSSDATTSGDISYVGTNGDELWIGFLSVASQTAGTDDADFATADIAVTTSGGTVTQNRSMRMQGRVVTGTLTDNYNATTGGSQNRILGVISLKKATGGTTDGVGAASGTGAATGVGRSTAASPGSASGTGAASGVGRALSAAVGAASGAGAASGVGASASAAVGSAAGVGAALGVAGSGLVPLSSTNAQIVITDSTADTTDATPSGSYTVGAGTEILLVAAILQENSALTGGGVGEVTALTYDGQALTRAVFKSGTTANKRAEFWYLLDPPAGSHTLAATLDAKTDSYAFLAVEVHGDVDHSTPIGGVGTSEANLGNTTKTVDVVSTVDNSLLFAAVATYGGGTAPIFTPTNGDELIDDVTGSAAGTDTAFWLAERLTTTAGTYTLSATTSASSAYVMAGFEIIPEVDPGEGVGAAAGTGAASAVGASLARAVGAASGTGAASAVGASTARAVGNASGTGAATATGLAIEETGVGSASGVGLALGVSASLASAVGLAIGSGTAAGIGFAIGWQSVPPASGVWTDAGDETDIWTPVTPAGGTWN